MVQGFVVPCNARYYCSDQIVLLTERLLSDGGADVLLIGLYCLERRNAAQVVLDIFVGSFHGDACVGVCYIVQLFA